MKKMGAVLVALDVLIVFISYSLLVVIKPKCR